MLGSSIQRLQLGVVGVVGSGALTRRDGPERLLYFGGPIGSTVFRILRVAARPRVVGPEFRTRSVLPMVTASSQCVRGWLSSTGLLRGQFLFADHGKKAWLMVSVLGIVTAETRSSCRTNFLAHLWSRCSWALL